MSSQVKDGWKVWNLGLKKVPPNTPCSIFIQNKSSEKAFDAGVRSNGSSMDRKLSLSPKQTLVLTVYTDENSKIEKYIDKESSVEYILRGFFKPKTNQLI